MAGRSASAPASQRPLPRRILRYPARVILSALMSLAVTVLERRLRKRLRSSAEPVGQAGP
jgi:ribose 1,5-bisphosphokinase PhnN